MRKVLSRLKPAARRTVAFLESAKARPAELAVARYALKHLLATGLVSAGVTALIEQVVR